MCNIWSEAAQYIQSATGTKYLRKGMYKYSGEFETKMQIIYMFIDYFAFSLYAKKNVVVVYTVAFEAFEVLRASA